MKLQSPNPKSQRSSKPQAPKGRRSGTSLRYSADEVAASRLKEEPNGHGAPQRPFALEERTAQFGEAIVRFAKKIPRNPANDRLISQLVGCGTSVGANYCEADERVSKKGFSQCDRPLCQRSEGEALLPPPDRGIRAVADRRSTTVVSRSKRTAFNLREHLPKMTMHSSIGIWSLELLWDLEPETWDFRS